jgi:hypothetical protein
MNIYFLVEGEAELGVYPTWIDYLFDSKLQRCLDSTKITQNQYFIVNGGGRKMFSQDANKNSIFNSIREINQTPKFDWFVIILDSEFESISDRILRVRTDILRNTNCPTLPATCQLKIIVQNKCFETWLCGHLEAFAAAQSSTNKNVKKILGFYNVATNDPELMTKDPAPQFGSLSEAKYHAVYLHHLLLPKKYN